MEREPIKNWQGRIIGFLETDKRTGDQVLKDFYGRILGKYDSSLDITKDFYGRRVAKGNRIMMLLKQ